MFRPIFSASHSASLKRKQQETENPILAQWNHQMGIPGVFEEIWGPYVDIPTNDGASATPQDTDEEETTTSTQDHDEPPEHEGDEHDRPGLSKLDSHGRAIDPLCADDPSPCSLPPRPSFMATNTRLWISLWSVRLARKILDDAHRPPLGSSSPYQ